MFFLEFLFFQNLIIKYNFISKNTQKYAVKIVF